jgi:glutathione synthase/RimK-type ligase-like ATP-grasp enzyme
MIRLVAKKGSKAAKAIRDDADINGYFSKPKTPPDALVNYGLAGTNLDAFYRKFPSARKIPTINRNIGHSKLSVCRRATEKKIPVPESKMTLGKADDKSVWIEKRTNSIGGLGIRLARGKGSIQGKYYQKYIDNRRYELRVHAFAWIPKDEWRVQKRLGDPKEIAWNYKNGGHFATVHNPKSYKVFVQAWDVSEQILELLGMSFGAVDFLVDRDYNLYFIEINSAPGFSELSKPIYIDAFGKLKSASQKELLKLAK